MTFNEILRSRLCATTPCSEQYRQVKNSLALRVKNNFACRINRQYISTKFY